MNRKQKYNISRIQKYIQKLKQKNVIRRLRLNFIKERSTEDIFDSVSEYYKQEICVVNYLLEFKHKMDKYPTESIDNRCLTNVYILNVKNRFPRRRRQSESRNRT